MVPAEKWIAPNVDQIKRTLRKLQLDDDPSWVQFFAGLEDKAHCPGCGEFQKRRALADAKGRAESSLAGQDAVKSARAAVRKIDKEWRRHVSGEDGGSHRPVAEFDVTRIYRKLHGNRGDGGIANTENDSDAKAEEIDVGDDADFDPRHRHRFRQSALSPDPNWNSVACCLWLQSEDADPLWMSLSRKCQMFTNQTVLRRRFADTVCTNEDASADDEAVEDPGHVSMDWDELRDIKKFILMVRAWEIEDYNFEYSTVDKYQVRRLWWMFRHSVDKVSPRGVCLPTHRRCSPQIKFAWVV